MTDHADTKGYSEETCARCGWTMGQPPLNCQNDDTPHSFPSQDALLAERRQAQERAKQLGEAISEWRDEVDRLTKLHSKTDYQRQRALRLLTDVLPHLEGGHDEARIWAQNVRSFLGEQP